MIEFSSNQQQEIPEASATSAKVIGVGGAGINVIDRLAMESMDGAGLLTLHTDVRALANAVTSDRIQLGKKLTHGLGAGGDPEIGRRAALEAESDIRAEVAGHRMVFVCAGLGGGTGSGAAPEVVRMARESGAFVVAFVTMPFTFEGARRLSQAGTALDAMRREANALITFDNDRMGELIVESEGIQNAFEAADRLIADSIRGVSALVTRPGLIKIGLDDLLTALRNSDSRCLFGAGRASGDKRGKEALRKALNSPLLVKGKMFSSARNILVHVTGGDDLRLHEIDGLMRELSKSVPDDAQLLFGAAVDPSMKKELSVTLFSSLSKDEAAADTAATDDVVAVEPIEPELPVDPAPEATPDKEPEVAEPEPVVEPDEVAGDSLFPDSSDRAEASLFDEPSPAVEIEAEPEEVVEEEVIEEIEETPIVEIEEPVADEAVVEDPYVEPVIEEPEEEEVIATVVDESVAGFDEEFEEDVDEPIEDASVEDEDDPYTDEPKTEEEFFSRFNAEPTVRIDLRSNLPDDAGGPFGSVDDDEEGDDDDGTPQTQSQLELERPATGEGRFAKSEPTIVDGEDLDTPAFLRKRKKR